jgi:hypothetical protein
MALHFDYASARAPTSSKRPSPTATRGSSYTAPLSLRFLYSFIEQHGRIAWQQKTGYGLRNLVELAMQRHKRIFGNTLKARALPQQKTEAWISASALNRMTNLGMPVSVKI